MTCYDIPTGNGCGGAVYRLGVCCYGDVTPPNEPGPPAPGQPGEIPASVLALPRRTGNHRVFPEPEVRILSAHDPSLLRRPPNGGEIRAGEKLSAWLARYGGPLANFPAPSGETVAVALPAQWSRVDPETHFAQVKFTLLGD